MSPVLDIQPQFEHFLGGRTSDPGEVAPWLAVFITHDVQR